MGTHGSWRVEISIIFLTFENLIIEK